MGKYFKDCPKCGGHLDPGEACNCELEDRQKKARIWQQQIHAASAYFVERGDEPRSFDT
jgi:hypothetical protein